MLKRLGRMTRKYGIKNERIINGGVRAAPIVDRTRGTRSKWLVLGT